MVEDRLLVNDAEVRKQLSSLKESLGLIEQRLAPFNPLIAAKAHYEAAIANLEGILVSGQPGGPLMEQAALPEEVPEDEGSEKSLRMEVLQILRENAPRTMRSEKIWQLAESRGCKTATRPQTKAVRYVLYALRHQGYPIKRTSRDQWRYLGG